MLDFGFGEITWQKALIFFLSNLPLSLLAVITELVEDCLFKSDVVVYEYAGEPGAEPAVARCQCCGVRFSRPPSIKPPLSTTTRNIKLK